MSAPWVARAGGRLVAGVTRVVSGYGATMREARADALRRYVAYYGEQPAYVERARKVKTKTPAPP